MIRKAIAGLYRKIEYRNVYKRFAAFTMIPDDIYILNLRLARRFAYVDGCVVECGTWKGGMIAGIASRLGNRKYFLFDSFEGLPEVQEIDGAAAKEWQQNTQAPDYFDNCKAAKEDAEKAMQLSGAKDATIIKGWFNETLPHFDRSQQIAVLRLDGDWYESTMCCLDNLYDYVAPGGVIIFDDYYAWDGCARAVHDFLSKRKLSDRICQWQNKVCYLVKK